MACASGVDPPAVQRLHEILRAPQPPFERAMLTEPGRAMRRQWLDIHDQLRRVHKIASAGAHRPRAEQTALLRDVKGSIVEAVLFLVNGPAHVEQSHASSSEEDATTAQQLRVWSSPQNARLAVIQEAIALAHSRRGAPLTHGKPPQVILISERAPLPLKPSAHHVETLDDANRRDFLDSWSSACYGVGEVLTVLADSADKVRRSTEHVFDGLSQSHMFPVLAVIYASCDSNITSDLAFLKSLCDRQNVRLCVEGPGLAMLAQSNRPSDPEECATAADVMLLDPAAWFGFRMCALVTWHKLVRAPVLREFKDHYSSLLLNAGIWRDQDETNGLATAPVLNLWTVLSKIGLVEVRNAIDSVTMLAECFINNFRDSLNIVTAYEGVGCVVRISYALSREDRLLSREKSQEHVSLVNQVLFASLKEESQVLCIRQNATPDGVCLQFSPARLLSCGTLWIPPMRKVNEYSATLQDTVDKYECCRAGSVAFQSCVAKCREIQLVGDPGDYPELHLSFGAFRIVPIEMAQTWKQSESSVAIVTELTHLVAKELTERPHDISVPRFVVQQETEKARALAEQFSANTGTVRSKFLSRVFHRRSSFPHGYDAGGSLPFDVFVHSDADSRFHEFVSIEPRLKCKPVDAVHQATIASDLMIACVTKIMGMWFAGEVTIPLEDGDETGRVSETNEDNAENEVTSEMPATSHELIPENQRYRAAGGPEYLDPEGAHGSEISFATQTHSSGLCGGVSTQDTESQSDSAEEESCPSATSRDLELEAPKNEESIVYHENVRVKQESMKITDRMKEFLSASTIEKSATEQSSGGHRTDDDAVPSEYNLPSPPKGPIGKKSPGGSSSAELVPTIDAVPVTQAATGSSWFGSWKGKGSENQGKDSGGDNSSSSSNGESSEDDAGENGAIENSEDEDDESQGEDSSSSSSESNEDHGDSSEGNNETSDESEKDDDDSDKDDDERDDDERDDDESDDDASDDENESGSVVEVSSSNVRKGRSNRGRSKSAVSNASDQSHGSKILSWIRGSKAAKSKADKKVKKPMREDNELESQESVLSSMSTDRDLEENETQSVGSLETESDSHSHRTSNASLSRSEHGSSESESQVHSQVDVSASESDSFSLGGKGKPVKPSRKSPDETSVGYRWFGWGGASSHAASTKTKSTDAQCESGLHSSSDTETVSQDSSLGGNLSVASRDTRLEQEDMADDGSSDETGMSQPERTESHSSEGESSYSSGPNPDRRGKTQKKKATAEMSSSDSANTSESDDDISRDNQGDGGSYFGWAWPSWATTAPKLGKRSGHIRGVNSQIRKSRPSHSSSDDESDESDRNGRRRGKGRVQSSARGKQSKMERDARRKNRYRSAQR